MIVATLTLHVTNVRRFKGVTGGAGPPYYALLLP